MEGPRGVGRTGRPAAFAWNQAFEPHLPVGRHEDGAWLYAPVGQFCVVDDGARVLCHACGQPLSVISAAHLGGHGLTQATYRERFGLNRKASLAAPALAEQRRAEGVLRWASNTGVRAGLATGQAMARNGELKKLASAVQPSGSRRTQGRVAASREGASAALRADRARRSAQAQVRWTERVRVLGFPDLDSYLAARRDEGASAHRVRTDLACGGSVAARLLSHPTSGDHGR